MTAGSLPPAVDIAVIGHGDAITGVAHELSRHAGDASWAVFSADTAGLDAPAEHLIRRGVSTAFSMGEHVELLLGQDVVRARAVVVAADSIPQIPGEVALRGRGVSYCASCDGALAQGRRVAAVLDSSELAHELDHLDTAEHVDLIDSASALAGVTGADRLEGVQLRDGRALDVSHLFMLTVRVPAPVLVPGILADEHDRIIVDAAGETSIPGIFAVGTATIARDSAAADASVESAVTSALTLLS